MRMMALLSWLVLALTLGILGTAVYRELLAYRGP